MLSAERISPSIFATLRLYPTGKGCISQSLLLNQDFNQVAAHLNVSNDESLCFRRLITQEFLAPVRGTSNAECSPVFNSDFMQSAGGEVDVSSPTAGQAFLSPLPAPSRFSAFETVNYRFPVYPKSCRISSTRCSPQLKCVGAGKIRPGRNHPVFPFSDVTRRVYGSPTRGL